MRKNLNTFVALVLSALLSSGPAFASSISSGASSSALSALTAATGANTLANGNNTGIVFNWANTTDSTVAFTFGETSAATGGTSTSGVPNQVLLKLTTLAASTQSPLSVYSRGSHVFSVSPSTAQILATGGTLTLPSYAFASATTSGLYNSTSDWVEIGSAGVSMFRCSNVNGQCRIAAGTSTIPGIGVIANSGSGLSWQLSSNSLSVLNSSLETVRWDTTGRQYFKAQTSVPTVNTCTNGSVVGTDNVMLITFTGANSTCSINFGSAWITNAPVCVSSEKTVTATTVGDLTTTTSLLTITPSAAYANTDTVQVICMGRL